MRNLFPPHLHKHLTAVSNAASNCVNINNLSQRGNINKSNIQLHRYEINCHKGCSSAVFDRGMTRAQKNQEGEWEKNQQCILSNNISEKKGLLQFMPAEMKLKSDRLIHQTERFANFDNTR